MTTLNVRMITYDQAGGQETVHDLGLIVVPPPEPPIPHKRLRKLAKAVEEWAAGYDEGSSPLDTQVCGFHANQALLAAFHAFKQPKPPITEEDPS